MQNSLKKNAKTLLLDPGKLRLDDLKTLLLPTTKLRLVENTHEAITQSAAVVQNVIKSGKSVYGINTGFGQLATIKIPEKDLEALQQRLILSHAAGTGPLLPEAVVRLILALKINSLARGYSGVRLETINTLIAWFNAPLYPCIPAKGSVGASGDLAPLAHLSAALMGVGDVYLNQQIVPAAVALEKLQLAPLVLGPKEGLALVNGTQVSTALALHALFETENLFIHALLTGALTVDAMRGSDTPFDARIQAIRGSREQIEVAASLREFLAGSEIRASHTACEKVQDPYSLRCQPQVMGACLAQLRYAAQVLLTEANAVSDNPLVFSETEAILSGGNFHAQPVAFAADSMALAIAEIGALSERRTALLIDPHFSGLPPFLVENPGINSGYMLPQVTAAALVSENKALATPSSVDSIPTSANQEDHVSMATYAARRLHTMTDNISVIIAIELLAACRGIDFLRPLRSSELLERVYESVRAKVPFHADDHFIAPDMQAIKELVNSGKIREHVPKVSFEFG